MSSLTLRVRRPMNSTDSEDIITDPSRSMSPKFGGGESINSRLSSRPEGANVDVL
jgi:hypothetical protein